MSVQIETEGDATAVDLFIAPHQVPVDIAPSERDVIEQEEKQEDGRTEEVLQQGENTGASKGTTAAKTGNMHRPNGSHGPGNSDGDRTATPVVISSPPPPTVFISCDFGPGQIGLRLEEDKADKDGAHNDENTGGGVSSGNTHSGNSGSGSGGGEGGDGGVHGVWVNGCVPGSVAAKAAILAKGDRLVTINALDVQDLSLSGVHELLASTPRPVNMTFARGGGGRVRGGQGGAEMRPSLPTQEQGQHEDVHAFTDEDHCSGSGGARESRGAGEDVEEGEGVEGGNSDTALVDGDMGAARNGTNIGKKRTIRVRRPSFNSPPPSTGEGSSAKRSPFEAANPKELIRSITSPSPDTVPGGSHVTEDGQGSADAIADAIVAAPNGLPNDHTHIDQQHDDQQQYDGYRDENTYDDRNADLQEVGQRDEQQTIEEVANYDRHFTGWDKRNDDYRGVRQEEERGRQRERPRPLRRDGAPRVTADVSGGRVTHRPFVAASRTLSVFSRPDGSPPDRHYNTRTGTLAGTRSMSPGLPPSRRRVEGRQGDGDGQQQQQQQQQRRVVGGRGGGGEREGGGRSHSASPVTAAVRVLMEAGVLQELGCKCKCTYATEHSL